MENSKTAAKQTHEIIVVVFKPGISYEKRAMMKIGENSSPKTFVDFYL